MTKNNAKKLIIKLKLDDRFNYIEPALQYAPKDNYESR